MRFAVTAVACLAGCAGQPHNNVLLFGTDTKVALDVSSAATSGGAPQITLGYRRAEAVWMPLVANRQSCDAENACRTETALDETGKPVVLFGQSAKHEGEGQDAYSVFASFGAKFSAEAGAGAKADGGLAQFFATGIAAQALAENAQIENALKVNNGPAAEGEAKKAAADAERLKAEADLKRVENELGKEKFAEIVKAATTERETAALEATLIVSRCGGPEGDKAKWDGAVGKAKADGLSAGGALLLSGAAKNADAIRTLTVNPKDRRAILERLAAFCP